MKFLMQAPVYLYILTIGVYSNIILQTTGGNRLYHMLSQYNHVAGTSSTLTFAVKVCDLPAIGLMTSENTANNMYEFVIYKSKGVDLRNRYHDERAAIASHKENDLVVCDEFRHFIIGWGGAITLQTYTDSSWRVLLSIDPLPNYFVNYVGVRSSSDADWVIFYQDISQWSTLPTLLNSYVGTGISWNQTQSTWAACAIACHRDIQCLSFSYNDNSKDCQGHKINFNSPQSLSTAVIESKQGSSYFFQQITSLE